MKILTATVQTQGEHPGDFDWCHEGELVKPPEVICNRDANDPNGGCGCGRSWSGLHSRRATTTAQVSLRSSFSLDDYTDAIFYSVEQWGLDKYQAAQIAVHLAEVADSFPVGTVVGHRLGALYVRAIPQISVLIDDALID